MHLTEYTPTSRLKPFIKSYLLVESEEGLLNRVLPNTSLTLAFRIKGQVSYVNDSNKTILPAVTISGLRKSVRLINYTRQSATIVVLFKETGASAFFGNGIHELYGQSISLDNFFAQSEMEMIEEQLEAGDNRSRIELIEKVLLSKLTYFDADELILDAIAKIHSVNGNIRIKKLAVDFCISQDAFEKRFRKITGATPKQFSHIVKMNSVIRQCQTIPSFLDVVFENGYYDQPHFNKDFKSFTGQTPTVFFRSASYW